MLFYEQSPFHHMSNNPVTERDKQKRKVKNKYIDGVNVVLNAVTDSKNVIYSKESHLFYNRLK